ncbi:uncharacterized protein LOC110892504 [Helianthus annuus]|uniref:uncharacterized protein LOC110892504 n=1 Tax=Helianthus annuus TaxID=4232 RepID=UPI000B8F9F81|nr:uncharacterized protein LOC110892504 [Helianthus annuus]
MVECNKNGRMKEWILKTFRGDTDFSKINWCAYLIQQIKSCKDGWKSCDPESPFSGPLTLLALLYVDRVKCTGFPVDRTIYPIVFWSKYELKKRERFEIKRGGFGGEDLHEVGVVRRDPRKTELHANDEVLSNEIALIEKHLDVMEAKRVTVQKKLEVVFNAHPDNEQVKKLIQRFEKIVHSKKTRISLWPDSPREKIAGVLMSLNKTVQNPDNDYTEDPEDDVPNAAAVAKINASGNDRGNGNGKRMKNDVSAKASGNDRGDGDGKRMKNDVSAKASGNNRGNGDGKRMKNDVSAKASGNDQGNGDGKQMKNDVSAKGNFSDDNPNKNVM